MNQSREYKNYLKCLSLRRNSFFLIIFFVLFFSALISPKAVAQGKTVKVAVAANLLLPMKEVKSQYENKFGEKLILIPGSSGKLTAQIINGAPYDIFLSADMKYPQQIYQEGYAINKPEVLVRGKLVFWSKTKAELPLEKWLVNVQNIHSIALAQAELAPYGKRAEDWLNEKEIYKVLLPKIIFGESIGQINQYIRSGTVEAAFTAISAMQAEEMKNIGYWYPLTVYGGDPSRLDHGFVQLKNAVADPDAIQQFISFIQSAEAEKIFKDFGYELP